MNLRQIPRAAALLVCLLGFSRFAAAADAPEIASIREALASRYPEVRVTDIRPSPIPGVYQVFSADAVVYVDKTGEYLIAGPLIATRTRTDLSQEALENRDPIDFAQLPLDKAIKTVRGNGAMKLAVFADPDCPYCHNLEKELAGLNDITIYTFLFPIVSLHPDARNKAHSLWCAPDRSAAWHDWMILDQAPPAPPSDCTADPVDALVTLGTTTLKIDSTPVLFLENGHRVRGARSAAQLNSLLIGAHSAPAGSASASSTTPASTTPGLAGRVKSHS